ncbi:reverse transcriptase domain-containing protein [Paraburkholderia caffeinilytica]|uniref:reverse transcriptase domain-containing protein n=1 Tax=Paraburkholderia caffeinilytica TaxID=1761016 RepID=UPI0038B8EE47
MSVIKEEYQSLAPQGESLSDIVVLAQAWKKSHTYIRRHNWYADVLELDSSTVDLESRLGQWANDVIQPYFLPTELLLVPAPKNKRWEFRRRPGFPAAADFLNFNLDDLGSEPSFDDWTPSPDEKSSPLDPTSQEQKLRPLAHVSIRDQTLATAVMMCLAEVVEGAQGDPSEKDVMKAREAGVASYGNRLQCRWIEKPDGSKRAHFSWGNSRTYRQYFDDYRNFLARPRRVCAELSSRTIGRKELFVVSLDIKSFFDCIDRTALLRELFRLETAYQLSQGLNTRSTSDQLFWDRTSRIFSWRWRDSDNQAAGLIYEQGAKMLKLGLPQGLVASGFFANAYLLGFDADLRKFCSDGFEIAEDTKVLDYCRYVDDLRIVVEAPSSSNSTKSERTLQLVKDFVSRLLRDHCIRLGAPEALLLSDKKCTITPYRSISAQSNVSTLMEVLNAELSGTFDLESLTQTAGGLEGLLWMSDQIEDTGPPKLSRLALASIAVPNTDVRDDTVKRFVATRLAQLMRHRLAMTDTSAPSEADTSLSEGVSNGIALSHEFEQTARKLIKCWADNPSLALLLRCGLDLFPHPKLLAPVIEALTSKLPATLEFLTEEQVKQVRTAEYVAADLLRAGAVETGYREAEEYPESIDIDGYREDLGSFARRILLEYDNAPWYLVQQARLFLCSIADLSLAPKSAPPGLQDTYATLQQAMLYQSAQSAGLLQVLPFALVAQQLNPNPRRFGVWLTECLRLTKSEEEQARAVMTVALNRPDLVLEALTSRAIKTTGWKKFVPTALLETSRRETKQSKTKSGERTLLRCMLDDENVFGQENGLLVLARALLLVPNVQERLSSGLSASEITVLCNDWSRIQSIPESADYLTVRLHSAKEISNPLYATPQWVEADKAWLYGLGRVLRAALTGEFDFTSRRYLVTEEGGRYAGLRSTWFKRRFGMLNSGHGLLDEPAPLSPWLSGLLSTLLQWPGVEFKANGAAAAAAANTPTELLALIERRIDEQRVLYGSRCKTPMYVVPVADGEAPLQDRPLRIAVVQPLRPRHEDFDVKDPTHWTPRLLKEHRRHLAEVCRLAQQQLRAWASAQPITDKTEEGPIVDVILFPELAVHPEHVALLRRLSDKLRANIFAGLTFIHSAKVGGPINQGLWLLRNEPPGHGRNIQYVWQGKKHPMKLERLMGVRSYRPHITLVELPIGIKSSTRIAAAICYDATDLDLVADLRDKSDVFLVAALNQDVQTFDNMVAALHFHMYQPVILANSGEFGGSTAQVPLPKHERLVAHVHGNNQIAVSVFEIDPAPFKTTAVPKTVKELKAPPAGYTGRPG